jgi:hypothetical protein
MKRWVLPLLLGGTAMFLCCAHDRVADYDQPLTSPGSKFTKLPPAVQNTLRAEAGTAEIEKIEDKTPFGPGIYEFHFRNPGLYPPLIVANDGSVLTSNMTVAVGASEDTITSSAGAAMGGLRLEDLPPNVVKTIHEKAPTSEVGAVQKIRSMNFVFYEVSFKESTSPVLLIADDGTLVKTLR